VKVLGIVGWSGAGKTTLIESAMPLLVAAQLRVSTVKHAHHGFDLDRPGKDSYRHRQAGAAEVLVVSGVRWALLHEVAGPEPTLQELLERLSPVDLVLIEGFKSHAIPKIEVHRPALRKAPLWPIDPDVVAVATDQSALVCDRPLLPLGDPETVAKWIRHFLETPAEAHGALEPSPT
jgi:molybdopterin-guanine dinucleotide biosynthesis protein B